MVGRNRASTRQRLTSILRTVDADVDLGDRQLNPDLLQIVDSLHRSKIRESSVQVLFVPSIK